MTGLSSLVVIGLFVATSTPLPTRTSDWVGLISISVIGSAGFWMLGAAFRAGPVSIVAPIVAANAAVIVILALVVHGDAPDLLVRDAIQDVGTLGLSD